MAADLSKIRCMELTTGKGISHLQSLWGLLLLIEGMRELYGYAGSLNDSIKEWILGQKIKQNYSSPVQIPEVIVAAKYAWKY